VGAAVAGGAKILRVHDVAAASDYLLVHWALDGGDPLSADLRLRDELRREPE
jgi:hypothetical protein